ncbi:MAG: hypothetical protein KatS3mg017_0463 [Fimbriimonadales bacterium]|nr:MAG: hypothetical protein KatS3mg017_0463 [Fimbriimonadales bacterium]
MQRVWYFSWAAVGAAVLVVGLTAQARPRPEVALLGVRVFTPVTQVVRKFGNPAMVTNTQVSITELEGAGQQQGGAGQPGFGEGAGQGGFAPPGQPPRGGDLGGGQGQTRIENEIVYVYRVKGGSNYLFQFNKDGRVVQISAYGRRPDPKVRTSRGVGFADPYSKVIIAYGQPDEHVFGGEIYVIRYNKLGVAFQLEAKTNRVTGIFVAAGIPTLGAGFTGLGGQGGGMQGPGAMGAPGGRPGRGGGAMGGGGLSGPGELPPPGM